MNRGGMRMGGGKSSILKSFNDKSIWRGIHMAKHWTGVNAAWQSHRAGWGMSLPSEIIKYQNTFTVTEKLNPNFFRSGGNLFLEVVEHSRLVWFQVKLCLTGYQDPVWVSPGLDTLSGVLDEFLDFMGFTGGFSNYLLLMYSVKIKVFC